MGYDGVRRIMQLLKKIGYHASILLGVASLVFVMFQGLGDPAKLIVGQTGDKKTLDNIRKSLNLDEPKWKQFVYYINDISPICVHAATTINEKQLSGFFIGGTYKFGLKVPYLRTSYQTKKTVLSAILEALPGTLLLAIAAMFIATVLGILLGVLAAYKKDTWLDSTTILTSIIGVSAPSFFMGIVLAYVFGLLLHQYTGLYITGSWFDINPTTGERYLTIKNLILPAITLGIRPLAIIAQLTRSSMLGVLGQDFIRTAKAKGLSNFAILFRHALKNALNPVITAITGWFAELLAGAFFVEYIFGWKGLGKLTVDALEKLDYPVVMGSVLVSACIFISINILADALYKWVDPRLS
jgi:peptide/nickel transport system permease protein